MINKIIQGDCLDVLKTMLSNSVDTIITDPPYGLSFMGKKWDYDVPSIDIWKECLRVLKPGGTALIFAGSRTQHRMACNVEDAGFILKDCIMWLYGCLSEDTEVLTKRGWKRLHKTTKYDKIGIYDITNNIYKWETPKRWSVYSVNKDTCYRIKSDKTDQIVSKEHRCLVEREGKLVFKQAWELSKMERVPILPRDFHSLEEKHRSLLFLSLFGKGKGLAKTIFSKWQGKEVSSKRNERKEEPSLERGSNLLQEEGKLWQVQNKICSLSKRVFGNGKKRRLCNGTQTDSSSTGKEMFGKGRSNTSHRPQSREQQDRKLNAIQKQQRPQTIRSTISKIEYTGKLFCPTVSTGAFVARRNGKVFITGNSGFPKATDISKQLDKGHKREETGEYKTRHGGGIHSEKIGQLNPDYKKTPITNPATPEAKLWNGWKSHGLKPAYEPILVAMKPNDGTYAENALKYGVSGLNIDGGRIGTDIIKTQAKQGMHGCGSTEKMREQGFRPYKIDNRDCKESTHAGRFPANILLSCNCEDDKNHNPDCPIKMLDEQSGVSKDGIAVNKNRGDRKKSLINYANHDGKDVGFGGKGGASRFFYCAKSSKSERNMGCEGLEEQQVNDGRKNQDSINCPQQRGITYRKNHHPTVKPLKLMEYLCTLTKTPTGGIVLDPFCGSGTTLMAAKLTGREYIGIEREQEYVEIARCRVDAVNIDNDLFNKNKGGK